MPKGWSRYEPVKKNSRFGVCGEPNAKREPRSEASIAFAVDPDYGPLFGERIEVVGRRAARAEIERRAELSLPCEWDQYGSHWRAVTEQLAGLEAENVVYRIDNVSGPRTFNYEVAVRRKGVLILLVLNTRTQEDRVLLTPLVVQALARYDQAAS